MLLQRERPVAPFAGFLPPPAPLPDLPAALSRRAAIFGAVVSTGALTAPTGLLGSEEAPGGVSKSGQTPDATLIALAAELDRTLDGAAYAMEPADDEEDHDRRLDLADKLMARMVALPAVGLVGVKAKAKAYLDSWSYDLDTADLSRSLAEDVERVLEGLGA